MTAPLHSYREIKPGVMEGLFSAPPSKSISHRMLIIAALSGKACQIKNLLLSDDVHITLHSLQRMGFGIELINDKAIFSGERKIPDHIIELDFGNSGTTARLLTAVAAALPGEYRLDGSERMRQRPMAPLITALSQLGVRMKHNQGFFPIRFRGGDLAGGEVSIDVSQSSQFLSGLLLMAPLTENGLKIIPTHDMASISYANLTRKMLNDSGIKIDLHQNTDTVPGKQQFEIRDMQVEGDYSSAAYFATGAVISGGEIRIENLKANSWQGDRIILDILSETGAEVRFEDQRIVIRSEPGKGIEFDMHSFPDLVPTVAVLALFNLGTSRFKNVGHLKYKESDRLFAIMDNIRRMGGSARMSGSDLIIQPGLLKGAKIATYQDHRIAMSFAVAGLKIPGIWIENPACVQKSFPDFWNNFDGLVTRK